MTALRVDLIAEVFSTGLNAPAVVSSDGAGAPLVDVPPAEWTTAARIARGVLGLAFLDWLSAVDEPDAEPPGMDVVLHVADPGQPTRRLLLRTRVVTADPHLASLTAIWPGVAWHERETYEMFGIVFDDFDDGQRDPDGVVLGLRPLLLPEGFEGTPLRKSFVLAARASKPWPGAKEPGGASPGRRTVRPPGVPDPSVWGPHQPVTPSTTAGADPDTADAEPVDPHAVDPEAAGPAGSDPAE